MPRCLIPNKKISHVTTYCDSAKFISMQQVFVLLKQKWLFFRENAKLVSQCIDRRKVFTSLRIGQHNRPLKTGPRPKTIRQTLQLSPPNYLWPTVGMMETHVGTAHKSQAVSNRPTCEPRAKPPRTTPPGR